MNVLGDAAGRDQHESIDHVGELVRKLHRHTAAERMPNDADVLDAQSGQQIAHAVGVGRYRVIGPRLVGAAVSEKVRGDDGVVLGQMGMISVHVDELSPMPCRSRTAGPSPAMRKARR